MSSNEKTKMDTLTRYQQILTTFIEECAAVPYASSGVKKQTVIDAEHGHFQLMSVGWHRDNYTCHIVLHIDIIDGKVWVQYNNTEMLIADELVERGILPADIVLGFHPPYARAFTGFAAA